MSIPIGVFAQKLYHDLIRTTVDISSSVANFEIIVLEHMQDVIKYQLYKYQVIQRIKDLWSELGHLPISDPIRSPSGKVISDDLRKLKI